MRQARASASTCRWVPSSATVGGKGIYTNPNEGDEGYAAAVGGGLQWKIGDSFGLFGEYYYSPDSLSSGIDSYQEANAGARWTIVRPITIEAGYRYLNLAGKDGNRDNAPQTARTLALAPVSNPLGAAFSRASFSLPRSLIAL